MFLFLEMSPRSVWKRVKRNLSSLLVWLCNVLAPVHFRHNVGVVLQGGDCYLTTVVFRQVRGPGGCRVGGNNRSACGGRRRVITMVTDQHGSLQPASPGGQQFIFTLQGWKHGALEY